MQSVVSERLYRKPFMTKKLVFRFEFAFLELFQDHFALDNFFVSQCSKVIAYNGILIFEYYNIILGCACRFLSFNFEVLA